MKLHQKLSELAKQLKALGEKPEWTDEDVAEETRLKSEVESTKQAIARDQRRAGVSAVVKELDSFINDASTEIPHAGEGEAPEGLAGQAKEKAVGRVEFKRTKTKNFKDGKTAYGFGQSLLAGLGGDQKAIQYCKDNGIVLQKAHAEGLQNTQGAIWVPEEYDDELINLVTQYGTARRIMRNTTMTSENKKRKRRTGGLTAFPVGETEAATQSTMGWDDVSLTARDWAVMTLMSNDWSEDSIINEADTFAGEMALAFALKEDLSAFSGDGTSTYHRIVGLYKSFLALGTIANSAGLQVASGNAWAEVILSDILALMGRLPEYAYQAGPRFYCSSAFYYNVLLRLILAAGGTPSSALVGGVVKNMFLGYPVELVTAMPKIEGNSTIPLYFGLPEKAGMFGDRKGIAIATTTEATVGSTSLFTTRQMAMLAVERFDLNWHDLGNNTAVEADKQAGPVVGLILAAA
jgi:HK97 family phage major capsid protein